MTRIVKTIPPYCASCFGHHVDRRHVDFEAAWDGPVIDGMSHKIAIDDLVICEQCLNEAFVLLDPQGQGAEIQRLEAIVNAQGREIARKDKAIAGYNMTNRELVDMGIERGQGRPGVLGVDDAAKKEINLRIQRRKQNKRERQVKEREDKLTKKEG